LINQYFISEHNTIEELQANLSDIEQKLQDMMEKNSGEEGLLLDVIEGENDMQKISVKSIKLRLKEIGEDSNFADEHEVLKQYNRQLENQIDLKNKLKTAQDELYYKVEKKYFELKEDEIKTLIIEYKWLINLSTAVQIELDRISQVLTSRIRELAERYNTPLPKINREMEILTKKVDEHLKNMGTL
jgi:type I restriction enzyme M protein